jgi:hypothetical protein
LEINKTVIVASSWCSVLLYLHHRIFLWQEPIVLYKENVIQENSKDAAAVASSSFVVQGRCKDVAADISCGSEIVQRHCCWQFMSFRKISKTLLPAGDSGHGKSVVTWDEIYYCTGRLMCAVDQNSFMLELCREFVLEECLW